MRYVVPCTKQFEMSLVISQNKYGYELNHGAISNNRSHLRNSKIPRVQFFYRCSFFFLLKRKSNCYL